MSNHKINLPKKKLYHLYWSQKKSPYSIARIYKCSFTTISNRLREYKIPLRTPAQSKMKYEKSDFSGDLIEKAYLIGFRLGDLSVYQRSPQSETVVVRTHTTKTIQSDLVKGLFAKYGQVTIKHSSVNDIHVSCFLNNTFRFLLPKRDYVELWIRRNRGRFASFAAGYIDAEGSFIVSCGRGRFKIDSYDKNILKTIHRWSLGKGIAGRFRLIGRKNQMRSTGYPFNNDLWRMEINEMNSILKFIRIVKPFMRHKKRIKDANNVLQNIKERQRKKSR